MTDVRLYVSIIMVEEADEVVLSSPRTSPSGRDREGVGVDFKSAAGTSQNYYN